MLDQGKRARKRPFPYLTITYHPQNIALRAAGDTHSPYGNAYTPALPSQTIDLEYRPTCPR